MSADAAAAPTGQIQTGAGVGALTTLRNGLRHSPELLQGAWGTAALAILASLGQVVVPIAVQQTLDKGINGPDGVDVRFTVMAAVISMIALVLTAGASYLMTARLFTASERGLSTLRIKAFRHIHDLPMLTQNTERRGALVARVTSDVDQISQFLVFGGLMFVVSVGQILVASVVMAFYNLPLAIVVWVCFAPVFGSIRWFQRRLDAAYTWVRTTVATMLSAVSEPVVGASVVKAYGIEQRTSERIDAAIASNQAAQTSAQTYTVVSFSLAGISGGLANAGVILGGLWLAAHSARAESSMSTGTILAFAFLVSLFVNPIQMATQILTDAQNAIASWRRVIGILDTPVDLVDPGPDAAVLPRGPIAAELREVTFGYPGAAPVLQDLSLRIVPGTRVAIVGETGSGKSTIAKLITRLMEPGAGSVLLDGIDLRDIALSSLRSSVVLVPQEGFLFDDTIAANVRYGDLSATDEEILAAADVLGLGDWIAGLEAGLATRAGQRGEALSAGERQLVALLRVQLADPDLLVLDEATSAVDPQLEMRINQALARLTAGRTSVTIAHRLSTAEAADEVVVMEHGRVAQRGPHSVLVTQPGTPYERLYRSWIAHHG